MGLQLFGTLALFVSIIVLFAAVDRFGNNNRQMVVTGELSQVLMELRQLAGSEQSGSDGLGDGLRAGLSDGIARLIGFGDVQITELSQLPVHGIFSREQVDLKIAKTSVLQAWNSAKKALADSTRQPDGSAEVNNMPEDVQLQQFVRLRVLFDRVFDAISQDTLSPALLNASSKLLATLKNIEFILANRDNLRSTAYKPVLNESLASMQSQIVQLVSLTTAESGGALIGYGSRQLLTDFGVQAKNVIPMLLDTSSGDASGGWDEQQVRLTKAADSVITYQHLLEHASYQNRRAILFALTALCFSLVCLMLALWQLWRNREATDSAAPSDLESLRSELTAIANGDLSVRASQQPSADLNAIAQAANHTVDMLTGLVRVFRRAGNHLNELAGSQQQLAKRWIKSEIKRHEQLELLSKNLDLQSQAIDQLCEIESRVVVDAAIEAAEAIEEGYSQEREVADSVAMGQAGKQAAESSGEALRELDRVVSACRALVGAGCADDGLSVAKNDDLTGEGLLRLRQRMHELTGTISAVRVAAEQARLQVLNTSLQMTAYAGSAKIDDQSRLVEDIQNSSNQLASSAAGAERMSSALADDLQRYVEAFASDKHELLNHFDHLQRSVNTCLHAQSVGSDDNKMPTSEPAVDSALSAALEASKKNVMAAALENVQQQHIALQQLLVALRSEADIVSDGDAMELLDQIGELQKIAASLARSAEVYGGTANE